MKLLRAEEIRRLDQQAITEFSLPGIVLMENAGRAVKRAAGLLLGTYERQKVAVLCGPGNNGGDGFVAARHLLYAGAEPVIYLLADQERVRGDAAVALEAARKAGVPVERDLPAGLPDLFVDALLGTGLTGEARESIAAGIDHMNESGVPVLSVDVPSGLNSDTGQPTGPCVEAEMTVTFGWPKVGLFLYPGRALAGEVLVADISLPKTGPGSIELLESSWVRRRLPRRKAWSHKGDHGRVVVIGGSTGMSGAVFMAGQAALRAGAGLVTLAVPESLNPVLEAKTTEVMTLPLEETDGHLNTKSLGRLQYLLKEQPVLVVGPGMGRSDGAAELVFNLVSRYEGMVVVDADALRAFSNAPGFLAKGSPKKVLTPHPGEASALAGRSVAEIQADRLGSAIKLSMKTNSTVVLKGAGTVVANPSGWAAVNSTGNPGMATGGMGDALAGVIAALMAQGCPPTDAAAAGVYLHGAAGDHCAGEAPVGYTVLELIERLPIVMQAVASGRWTDSSFRYID